MSFFVWSGTQLSQDHSAPNGAGHNAEQAPDLPLQPLPDGPGVCRRLQANDTQLPHLQWGRRQATHVEIYVRCTC